MGTTAVPGAHSPHRDNSAVRKQLEVVLSGAGKRATDLLPATHVGRAEPGGSTDAIGSGRLQDRPPSLLYALKYGLNPVK